MNEYIKELIALNEDIERKTNEAIKKVKPTKFQLLDKAIDKIYSHYDTLLDSMEGKYYRIKLDLGNEKYELSLSSNHVPCFSKDASRYAYIELDGYGISTSYILNKKTFGVCRHIHDKDYLPESYYCQMLKTSENKYHTHIIELVTKYHDQIQEEIKKHIEKDITNKNLESSKRISKEISLINTLDTFING